MAIILMILTSAGWCSSLVTKSHEVFPGIAPFPMIFLLIIFVLILRQKSKQKLLRIYSHLHQEQLPIILMCLFVIVTIFFISSDATINHTTNTMPFKMASF
jgi:hypothetical protein